MEIFSKWIQYLKITTKLLDIHVFAGLHNNAVKLVRCEEKHVLI